MTILVNILEEKTNYETIEQFYFFRHVMEHLSMLFEGWGLIIIVISVLFDQDFKVAASQSKASLLKIIEEITFSKN